MNNNWKDALSVIRNNFSEPEETQETEVSIENNTKNSILQKNPVRVIVDKKGRKGKIATIIEGLEVSQPQIEEIARNLKQKLGVGGSVREHEILIQGQHKDKIIKFLETLNFKVKSC